MTYYPVFSLKNFHVLLSSINIDFGQINPFSVVLLLSLLVLMAFLVAVGR